MKKYFTLRVLWMALCLGATQAQADELPYRATLSHTLNAGGWLAETPAEFAPSGDFSLNVQATFSPGTSNALVVKATNAEGLGFDVHIGATGITAGGLTVDGTPNDDGTAHQFRFALQAGTQTVYLYRDQTLLGTTTALFGGIVYPAIFQETDDADGKTGIYHTANLIQNPGFETAEITYDSSVTGSADTMFWPAAWNIYNGSAKSGQWNTGVRCYQNKDTYATGREGLSELMFRQDGGGGFTQGSAVYQTLAEPLRPNRRYRVSFEAMSHSNATGATFAVGVGSAAGTWDVLYQTWTAPTATLTTQNYSFDFTTPAIVGAANCFGLICAGTKGIVHIDRVTLVEAEGDYNSCTLTANPAETGIVLGETTYEAAALGSKPVLTNMLVDGGEYLLYNVDYARVLGGNADQSAPALSDWLTNDSLSYVYTAVKGADNAYYLVNKKTGKYLTASTANAWRVAFNDAPEVNNRSLWLLETGQAGTIKNVYADTYLGADAGSTDTYVNVYYDKAQGACTTWQIVEAAYPLDAARLQLYTASLKEAIAKGDDIYHNAAYGTAAEKQELAQALNAARTACEMASLDNLPAIDTARQALEAAIENTQTGNYAIWLSGSSFANENAFTVALNGTQLVAETEASAQFVLRNSHQTGALITLGHGYVKAGGVLLAENLPNTDGQHDYQFAFDGTSVTLYFDGEKKGTAAQTAVPATTSCGTAAEWTVFGLKALTAYNPEWVSASVAVSPVETPTNSHGKVERTSLMMAGQNIGIDTAVDWHILAGSAAMSETDIDLKNEDAWLIFDNVRPSTVISNYLPNIKIDGATATNGTNCRVAIYLNGAAVIPQASTYQPFEGFDGQLYAGDSYTFGVGKAALGKAANQIQSFILKRGYMVCLATNADGSGYSRVYVADHEDKRVDVLPDLLRQRISYVNVRRWNYVSKKGWANTASTSTINTEGDKTNATWFYTWGADRTTQTNMEYIPHKSHIYWPGWGSVNGQTNSTCVLGYNEPEHSEQHSSDKCSCGGVMSEWAAFTHHTEFFENGLRIGSPSPTDANWLANYVTYCNNYGYRCDFVVTHAYWKDDVATWKSNLESIHNKTGRPIWITELENGASWNVPSATNVTAAATKYQQIFDLLESLDYVERYVPYNVDLWYNRMIYAEGGLTPAGQIFRDHKTSFAYKESAQYVPVGWFPSFKTTLALTATVGTARKVVFAATNPNGDFTASQEVEYLQDDDTYAPLYIESDRSLFDNTGTDTQTHKIEDLLTSAPFVNPTITLRLKVTSLNGDVAYSDTVTANVPLAVQRYYQNLTGIDGLTVNGLRIEGGSGQLTIESETPCAVRIFAANGKLVRTVRLTTGSTTVDRLPKGIYVVEGQKVAVR